MKEQESFVFLYLWSHLKGSIRCQTIPCNFNDTPPSFNHKKEFKIGNIPRFSKVLYTDGQKVDRKGDKNEKEWKEQTMKRKNKGFNSRLSKFFLLLWCDENWKNILRNE